MTGDGETTIREAYMQASSFLERNRVDEAKLTAERLMCHVLGWTRTQLFLRWPDPFPEPHERTLERVLERRANGEPLQYITGEQEFFGLAFKVNPSVLIPRPETEILVEAVLRAGRELWPPVPGAPERGTLPLIADIGTGSGAIAVTLARLYAGWRITATDLSAAALETARGNAARLGQAERITFLQGDLLEPFVREGQAIDALVSNPPYIESAEITGLQREVREHEPWSALDGGKDGLDCYRRMLAQIEQLPRPPRLIAFEVGHTQARTVAGLLEAAGYTKPSIICDLSGIERHVLARK